MPSEGREIINHRAILLVLVVAAIGAAVVVGLLAFQQKASSPPQSQVLNQTSMSQPSWRAPLYADERDEERHRAPSLV